jgi:hypothetical protein
VLRNRGDGLFETVLVIEEPEPTDVHTVLDVDGNGFEDVVISVYWSFFNYDWIGSNGSGFAGRGSFGSGDGLVLLADFDQDGDVEGITHFMAMDFLWSYTEGNGGLRENVRAKEQLEFSTCLIGATDVGDINRDGRLDFACSRGPIWFDGNLLDYSEQVAPTPSGDVNNDGMFDSSDLLAVLQAGKYEDGRNASFDEGDWNRDGQFDSADLVLAFADGHYESQTASVTQPTNVMDWLFSQDDVEKRRSVRPGAYSHLGQPHLIDVREAAIGRRQW